MKAPARAQSAAGRQFNLRATAYACPPRYSEFTNRWRAWWSSGLIDVNSTQTPFPRSDHLTIPSALSRGNSGGRPKTK